MRGTTGRLRTIVIGVLVAMASGAATASAADPDLTEVSTPDPTRGVVYGVVLDDDGLPYPQFSVNAQTNIRLPGGGSQGWHAYGTSDSEGRYRIVLRERTDDLFEEGYVLQPFVPWQLMVGPPPRAFPKAGEAARVDLVARRNTAVIRGRVSVEGGASTEGLRVLVHVEGAQHELWGVTVRPDGTWEVPAPRGVVAVRAESRFGLPTGWLGPQPGGGPAKNRLWVGSGETREGIDLTLRRRLPYPAVDEYGMTQRGSDVDAPYLPTGPHPWPRYPLDERPPVGSITGPIARIGPFEMPRQISEGRPEPWLALPYGFNTYAIPIENDGDAPLRIREVTFEGRDAALFRCERTFWASYPLTCRQGEAYGEHATAVEPGRGSLSIPIVVDQTVHRDVYEATAVVRTNAQTEPVRVQMRVVNRTGELPCPPPSGCPPQGAAPVARGPGVPAPVVPARGAAAPTPPKRTSVPRMRPATTSLRRRKVSARVAAAGRIVVRVDTRRARRWRTARRATLVARRAGMISRSIRALPRGTHRAVLRFTPAAGGPVQVATTTYRVR